MHNVSDDVFRSHAWSQFKSNNYFAFFQHWLFEYLNVTIIKTGSNFDDFSCFYGTHFGDSHQIQYNIIRNADKMFY